MTKSCAVSASLSNRPKKPPSSRSHAESRRRPPPRGALLRPRPRRSRPPAPPALDRDPHDPCSQSPQPHPRPFPEGSAPTRRPHSARSPLLGSPPDRAHNITALHPHPWESRVWAGRCPARDPAPPTAPAPSPRTRSARGLRGPGGSHLPQRGHPRRSWVSRCRDTWRAGPSGRTVVRRSARLSPGPPVRQRARRSVLYSRRRRALRPRSSPAHSRSPRRRLRTGRPERPRALGGGRRAAAPGEPPGRAGTVWGLRRRPRPPFPPLSRSGPGERAHRAVRQLLHGEQPVRRGQQGHETAEAPPAARPRPQSFPGADAKVLGSSRGCHAHLNTCAGAARPGHKE